MDTLKKIAVKQQLASPDYFEDPGADAMIATILALAEEVCVLRDRLDTCRRLAADDRPATQENIESFVVSDSLQAERLQNHATFFEHTLTHIRES